MNVFYTAIMLLPPLVLVLYLLRTKQEKKRSQNLEATWFAQGKERVSGRKIVRGPLKHKSLQFTGKRWVEYTLTDDLGWGNEKIWVRSDQLIAYMSSHAMA